jgi:hypothetical protein
MYVFSKEITDATANKSKEMVRLFNLPDLWLGAELLRLAQVQACFKRAYIMPQMELPCRAIAGKRYR